MPTTPNRGHYQSYTVVCALAWTEGSCAKGEPIAVVLLAGIAREELDAVGGVDEEQT